MDPIRGLMVTVSGGVLLWIEVLLLEREVHSGIDKLLTSSLNHKYINALLASYRPSQHYTIFFSSVLYLSLSLSLSFLYSYFMLSLPSLSHLQTLFSLFYISVSVLAIFASFCFI